MIIALADGLTTKIDDADAGLVSGCNLYVSRRQDGSPSYVIADRGVDGGPIGLSRLILGAEPGEIVDHINGDIFDNRRANLRICTHAENMRNRRVAANNASGFKGVYRRKNERRFAASITFNKRQVLVGWYDTPVEAATAYDIAAKHYFGEFARPNFDPKRDWLLPHVEVRLERLEREPAP